MNNLLRLSMLDDVTQRQRGTENFYGTPRGLGASVCRDRPRKTSSAHAKLLTIEPTTRFQPSIITNSRTLNGSDTIAGGICNMPIDSSVVETTRSMSRKGTKRKKPIWKPVLSSEMTYAGMTTRIGNSDAVLGFSIFPGSLKSTRSA